MQVPSQGNLHINNLQQANSPSISTMESEEILEIIDFRGNVIGYEPRKKIHGDPSLPHRVVHVLVTNGKGDILLQKRSQKKDVAPGKWDTSVGGHVGIGEDLLSSSKREMLEELGITGYEPEFLYSYIHSNEYETEMVTTFHCTCEHGFSFNEEEIDDLRFWSHDEIGMAIGRQILSDNFEQEFRTYLEYLRNTFPC
jgi:isopentenyldiphosphate isomerase